MAAIGHFVLLTGFVIWSPWTFNAISNPLAEIRVSVLSNPVKNAQTSALVAKPEPPAKLSQPAEQNQPTNTQPIIQAKVPEVQDNAPIVDRVISPPGIEPESVKNESDPPETEQPDANRLVSSEKVSIEKVSGEKHYDDFEENLLTVVEVRHQLSQQIYARLEYPRIARKRGWQDQLTASVLVSSAGRVLSAKIIEPSQYDVLNHSAGEALKQIQQGTSILCCIATATQVDVLIEFRLQ